MAECKDCGKRITFLTGIDGRCEKCAQERSRKRLALTQEAEKIAKEEKSRIAAEEEAKIASVVLTTEAYTDLKIEARIEIVTAECAFGMNIFKDLFAGVRDVIGGRSEAVQKTMRDSRKTVLFELKREAYLAGANAVVGVDLDYVELSASGSMVMLVASGTAVKIVN